MNQGLGTTNYTVYHDAPLEHNIVHFGTVLCVNHDMHGACIQYGTVVVRQEMLTPPYMFTRSD